MARTRRQTAKTAQLTTARNDRPVESDTDRDSDEDEDASTFMFDGVSYPTYQLMVEAKRARNRDLLASSGLLEASQKLRDDSHEVGLKRKEASRRGIRPDRKRNLDVSNGPRRKSSRIAGVKAEGFYVEQERAGKFVVHGLSSDERVGTVSDVAEQKRFFNDRVNDGSELSVREAIKMAGARWVKEKSVEQAEEFMRPSLSSLVQEWHVSTRTTSAALSPPSSPRSVAKILENKKNTGSNAMGSAGGGSSLEKDVNALAVDDDGCVAKVVPERIYSVACHPSSSALVVCAGDKLGHVGIWNVDGYGVGTGSDSDGVHLFKPHNRPVAQVEWDKTGMKLLSASYDGSVRRFDIASQKFEQIFATYDDSEYYKNHLGYGIDTGHSYWVQYLCMDHRSDGGQSFFMSTSAGTVMHVDLRDKGRITFHEKLSEKKINSISLHPNGSTMATAGLDNTVRLWDVRTFGSAKKKVSNAWEPSTSAKSFASQNAGKSVNSAFFSPSGKSLLTTTMANYLDVTADFHLGKGVTKASTRIRHNNMTGRWLSTFMAQWHPGLHGNNEMFVVGSMKQPRTIEVFDGKTGGLLRGVSGDALTAVASRCCFHPSAEKMVIVGGNSSGRVTVAR